MSSESKNVPLFLDTKSMLKLVRQKLTTLLLAVDSIYFCAHAAKVSVCENDNTLGHPGRRSEFWRTFLTEFTFLKLF